MGRWKLKTIFLIIFTACVCYSNGCTIEGVPVGDIVHAWVNDTFRGTFWQNRIEGITGILSSETTEYYSIDFINSHFVISTTELFELYEENEVEISKTLDARLTCPESNPALTIWVHVIDSNNNDPVFLFPPGEDEFVFTINAPVPPGYEITGCLYDMIVRDIDLTTDKIIFEIEENDFFEIEKEVLKSDATPKEFSAIIRTKTFIRSLQEEIKLKVSATDHDKTPDKPRTATTIITIKGNSAFELPEEPVFSQTFYLADYTSDNRVVLTEPITLQAGYDELVKFDIKGGPRNNFELELIPDHPNQRSIRVVTQLEGDDLRESIIHLIVTADREDTSGASATVVLRLPEVVPLEFQNAHYEGKIVDNNLRIPPLILRQGYEGATVTATVRNEHPSFFSATVQGSTVTLSMRPLDESILEENSFLNLEVLATNGLTTATTVVTLKIVKDDNITPVFNKAVYTGSYNPNSFTLDEILLVQGHDGIDAVELNGEHKEFFEAELTGTTVTVRVPSGIPLELYSRGRIVLSLEVRKPRTVGARAAIIIDLPAARELKFGASTHRGSLQDNVLNLDPIPLAVGYDSSVVFSITGDHEDYFEVTSGQNPAIITVKPDIPGSILLENNIIILTLAASGPNAVTTTTSVLLDIIKDDTTTPVFSRNIYYGTYLGPSQVNIDDIELSQGFDNGVTFRLDGDHAQYFKIEEGDKNNVVVVPRTEIPEDIIFKEKVLVFKVLAEKALTVGANAAISIKFPSDLTERAIMRFSQNTYTGAIESNILKADNIALSSGYEAGTEFILTGVFREHFVLRPNDDDGSLLSLSLDRPLPVDATENAFIVLEIEARRERAVPAWTSVVIEIISQEIVAPIFTQTYYRGAYDAESGLQFNQEISLSHGYDDTVSFSLDGEFRPLFTLIRIGPNSLSIAASAPISNDLLEANNQFLLTVVATKPGALDARSAVSIDIEKDQVVMRFSQNTYTGAIESANLKADNIALSSGYEAGTQFILTGVFREYFVLRPNDDDGSLLSLSLDRPLPVDATENAFIVLEIEARRERAVPAWTSVVIEIITQEIVAPIFTQAYYRGAYNAESGLQFNQEISLSHGYDDTVSFSFDGEFRPLFTLNIIGPNSLSITASAPISNDLLQANNQFLLTVVATKPGALDARSVVSIDIEKDSTDRVVMRFSQNTYTGAIESAILKADNIALSTGYEAGTQFILTGVFREHFVLRPNDDDGSLLSLSLDRPLPVDASENAFIVLEIEARRERAVPAWTSVVIEIITQEIVAPIFTQAYYRGIYNAESGLQFNQEISLSHGYDDTVSFSLDGEFRPLFTLNIIGPNLLSIAASAPISNDLLQANNQFLLTVVATKPGALDAQSAVSIDIEKDTTDRVVMRFSQNTYTGAIESAILKADNIALSTGYEAGTQFILTGVFREHFVLRPNDDDGSLLSLSLDRPLPVDATENAFIVLEIEARRERAVPAWTSVVIEIITQEIVAPIFTQAYYRGAYNAESGLQFNQEISLSHGYDDTVSFSFDGEFRPLFTLNIIGPNSLSITASAPISNDLLQANNQFLLTVVATKPGALDARSVVSIDIEKDSTDRVVMRFSQNTYTGAIESAILKADNIALSTGYEAGTQFILTGVFREHFVLRPNDDDGSLLSLSLDRPLPVDASENAFIVLEIEARRERAVPAWTSVVIEIITQEIVAPIFTQAYYRGAYNAESGLQFNQEISLSHGYDDTVSFSFDGEFRPLFTLNIIGPNSLSITASAPISNDLLQANNQFLLTVVATKPGALDARSVVSIDIEKDSTDRVVMRFSQNTYTGAIESAILKADNIALSTGYEAGTQFILTGVFREHFVLRPNDDDGSLLSLSLDRPLPVDASENAFIVLEIEARRERAVPAWTSVVIEIITQEIVAPIFTQAYYRGIYNAESGLQFNQEISLSHGYDDTVSFSLDGEFRPLFTLNIIGPNSLSIAASAPISNDLLQVNNQFLLTVVATKPGALDARSAVSIDIEKDTTDRVVMRFSQNTYTGAIESAILKADNIALSTGYEAGTQFILTGVFREYFVLRPNDDDGSLLSVSLDRPLPVDATENAFIVLEIEARRERAVPAWTSVVIEIITQEIVAPIFTQAYYRGAYNAESGLQFNQEISLSHGYDDTVSFSFDGEFRPLFTLNIIGPNSLSITASAPISNDLLQANNQFLLTVVATKPGALDARSVVSIDIEKDSTDRVVMRFSQNTYTGAIESAILKADNIALSTGYEAGTQFILTGVFREHFVLRPNDDDGSLLSLSLDRPLPVDATENAFIVLEIEARRERAVPAWTSVVIEIITQEIVAPIFTQAYYRGIYNAESGLQFNQEISLSHGYDDTVYFSLDGEFRPLFTLNRIGPNSLSIATSAPISNDLLEANNQFLLTVVATKPGALDARSAVSIDIEKDSQTGHGVSFGKYLYEGVIDLDEVRHEPITLAGYDGTSVEILGVYSHLFEALVSGGGVDVQTRETLNLPADVTTVALELRAGKAGTALFLRVLEPDEATDPTDPTVPTDPTDPAEPTVPTVTFSSELYVLSVDMTQTGLVGRVSATADNREDVTYSLGTDDAHLQTRLSINNEGELYLSAPTNSGVYTFQVIATTVNTRATGTAAVHLTVQAVMVCENNSIAIDPLIILDRDEEASHNDLVLLDPTLHAGCHYTLTNRWPIDQTWLYVNEIGLHTIPIDREHASIAFMPLSQVQVELTLHCEGDSATRAKRSERTERLGDYGSNKWILTDTITHNSRRSLVNLIVNDINDNSPIFVGKENEPIAVGYPTGELEERILPRSLAELKATDADIGENAALRYSSSESVLAVAPTTGFVHVRSGAQLQQNQVLTVTATDRNGNENGLSGTIQLVVKLLDMNHIAVVTVRNAFLDDEILILAQLSDAVGYEVKTLRSVVISDDIDEAVTRNKRETSSPGASLQLYVYGLNEGEPVAVDLLTAHINANAAMAGVVSTIPLEDYLQDMDQVGLLVATIILSILLFAVILLVAIWFFLRWRKNKNYDEFNDENSLASRNSSQGELPKLEVVKPRLNIEDLKKSEKRLQEMLHAPIEEVTVEPMPKKTETTVEAQLNIIDLPIPEPSAPIVIQSIDKLKDAAESSDDEFGEVSAKPRKSVVTFNENVEKIIHLEDNADDDGDIDDAASITASVDASNGGLEIYRL